MNDLKDDIRSYLAEIPNISVASCAQDKPWICNVYYAFDEDLNIYFVSKTFRRHSEEIRNNPNVSAAICKSTFNPFVDKGQGIQLEGHAIESNDEELTNHGLAVYLDRFPESKRIHETANDLLGDALPRIYQIKPSRIVLFDEVNAPEDPQRVLELNITAIS